jgi:squalene-hopene/tetraprenyl-beta-curcumene cyclase
VSWATRADAFVRSLKKGRRVQRDATFAALPPPRTEWQRLAWRGVDFLLREWPTGFRDAGHTMIFPYFLGFTGDRERQYGDVFQRGIIADALCDADDLLAGALRPAIRREAMYLVGQRLMRGFGGWSYFPGLPELPPDADDLGQVIQVLVRSGHTALADEHASPPLRVLFRDCVGADGSFETWIIPARDRTAEQERQFDAAREKWGTGSDAEVMANLLYALTLYDATRFETECHRGAEYIERCQQPDGSWSCRWYFGPYYGTYACARFIHQLRPRAGSLARAADFIRSSQLSDGSWPQSSSSSGDALSTALGLLGLAVTQRSGDVGSADAGRAARARAWLDENGDGDSWPSCSFIRPSRLHSYGSPTMTTAYVMKAALAWDRVTAHTESTWRDSFTPS